MACGLFLQEIILRALQTYTYAAVGHLQQASSRPMYSGLGVCGRPKSTKSKLFTMVVRLRLG